MSIAPYSNMPARIDVLGGELRIIPIANNRIVTAIFSSITHFRTLFMISY